MQAYKQYTYNNLEISSRHRLYSDFLFRRILKFQQCCNGKNTLSPKKQVTEMKKIIRFENYYFFSSSVRQDFLISNEKVLIFYTISFTHRVGKYCRVGKYNYTRCHPVLSHSLGEKINLIDYCIGQFYYIQNIIYSEKP